MTRTFIALELDESLQRYLGEIIRRMARELPGLRWVDPAGIHLTLAFLGELNDQQLAEATRAAELSAQSIPSFEYRLSHPGIFGSPRQPRVIWIGVEEPSGNLQLLHHQLNLELAQCGFEIDTRPFSPHLTLARIKAPLKPEELQHLQRMLAVQDRQPHSSLVRARYLSVMKSELMRTGARYTSLRDVPLGLDKG
jgi:RNA 2',3'-cyclic 3'-phosphodiesterase